MEISVEQAINVLRQAVSGAPVNSGLHFAIASLESGLVSPDGGEVPQWRNNSIKRQAGNDLGRAGPAG